MPQESFGVLLVNERGKAIDFWAPPDMQLDHILAVVDAPLKRWQIPQSFNRTKNAKPFSKRRRADRLGNKTKLMKPLLLISAAALLPVFSQAQSLHVEVSKDRDSEHEHYYHHWTHHRHHLDFWQRSRYWDRDEGRWIYRREWIEPELEN
jgi:hypothetical protein